VALLINIKISLFISRVKNDSSNIVRREISYYVVFLYLVPRVIY
jgi:hypothetical protein